MRLQQGALIMCSQNPQNAVLRDSNCELNPDWTKIKALPEAEKCIFAMLLL